MNDDLIFIKAIQDYMLEHDINQEEMSCRLGVSPAALGKWLLGRNGITRRNREKIRNLCSKWLVDPAAGMPGMSEEEKRQIRVLVASRGRASLASLSSDPVSAAVEAFRNLVIMEIIGIKMPIELRNELIRAVSNIEAPKTEENK